MSVQRKTSKAVNLRYNISSLQYRVSDQTNEVSANWSNRHTSFFKYVGCDTQGIKK